MTDASAVPLDRKLDVLGRALAPPGRPDDVEVVETHFAWVFLARELVYKLKKPIRRERLDLRTLEARHRNCRREVALNRRLAEDVYLGVVPLARGPEGLVLEGEGTPVEWLVKMRRLPAEHMLDQRAAAGDVGPGEIDAVMARLSAFYRRTARADFPGEAYVARLRREVGRYRDALLAIAEGHPGLDPERVAEVASAQQASILRHRPLLAARAEAGRVVDAHGDLKPEHVCLLDPPRIIDCLEFDDDLRLLDTAEEIAFLALECERLGHPRLACEVRGRYVEVHGDPCPPPVWRLYRSVRAVVRAFLAADHLHDDGLSDRDGWLARTRWYLAAARGDLTSA